MNQFRYEIIHKDWQKRRIADKVSVLPVSVEIDNMQLVHNHFCKMKVTYSDSSVKELISRVLYNSIKKSWAVDGMEVAVRVIIQE